MEENSGDVKEVERLVDDLSARHEVLELTYQSRAKDLDFLFDCIPNSDRHWLCDVKHDAARFVMGAETYHASGFNPALEETLVLKGRILALTCSKAFNMDVMDCLRCLNDALNAKMGFDQKETIVSEIQPTKEPSKVEVTTDENGARVIKKIDIK